jgi:hypothetical protein
MLKHNIFNAWNLKMIIIIVRQIYSNNTHMRGKKVPRKRKRRGETRIMIKFGEKFEFHDLFNSN